MSVALRFVSLILIVFALMLLGADLVTSLEKGGVITVRSIEQVWMLLNKSSAVAFTAWLQHSLPVLVSGWISRVLSLPAWSLTGVLGVILAFLFGRRVADVA
ncbi:MAG: hypothetical protein ACLQUZ_08930 [Rhizomicrobium sp.]